MYFTSPVHSLLQFIPIGMRMEMVKESNRYDHQLMDSQLQFDVHGTISGKPWMADITIDELMTFFGIMINMCIRPIPGRTYTEACNNIGCKPSTTHIKCGKFQQIRAVLHVSDNLHEQAKTDSLWKVRHLFKTLKISAERYVNVGTNLSRYQYF